MNKEFDTVAGPAHPTINLSDFDLAMQIIGEMRPDAPKPDFVTVASWFTLHEMVHSGEDGGRDNNFIHNQDIVNDDRWDCDDIRQVFGFRDDADGCTALQMIQGWMGLDDVWKRAQDGTYQPFDLAELGDNPHAIDLSNPDQVNEAVSRVFRRESILMFPSVLHTSRKPIAAALEQM